MSCVSNEKAGEEDPVTPPTGNRPFSRLSTQKATWTAQEKNSTDAAEASPEDN